MCLAIPGKIESISGDNPLERSGKVNFGGVTRDVSAEANYVLANPGLVTFTNCVFSPAADGVTELSITFEGQSLKVPVTVKDAAKVRPMSFRNDVMPVFMRAGCNAGSCHGAARGKDGFRLSLFGFDPEGDYQRITREMAARRANLARASRSAVRVASSTSSPQRLRTESSPRRAGVGSRSRTARRGSGLISHASTTSASKTADHPGRPA